VFHSQGYPSNVNPRRRYDFLFSNVYFFILFRSLRKVMLKTCISTDPNYIKDYPRYAESKIPFHNGNGDIFHGSGGAELKEALSELLPEEIPGLPRHRPGEFSPR